MNLEIENGIEVSQGQREMLLRKGKALLVGQVHGFWFGRVRAFLVRKSDSELGFTASAPVKIHPDYSWGPVLWQDFHLAMENLSEDEIHMYLDFFWRALPCGPCRKHWLALMESFPFDFSNPKTWGIARHNDVNLHLNKPIFPYA